MPMTASSELSAWYNESAAVASSSKARCSSPDPLPESPRAKIAVRPPVAIPSNGSHRPHPDPDYLADTHHSDPSSSSSLIPPPSHRHSPRQPKLQPSSTHLNFNTATLFSNQYTQQTQHPRHVVPPINQSFTNDPPDTTGQHGSPCSPLLEHFPPSCASTSSHVSITSSPWTHPVFTNPNALAAHHGIPQSLPPVPRTTRYSTTENQAISSPSSNNDFDFSTLRNNYLNMLSQKPADILSVAQSASFDDDGVQAVLDMLIASPEYQSLGTEFPRDYLTSPMDDSPWEDILATPAIGENDFLTSPAIFDSDDFSGFGEAPLFPDSGLSAAALEAIKAVPSIPAVQHPVSFDGLYTMPSPDTPSLDPSSLNDSVNATPALVTPDAFGAPSRRKNPPTGTRKNITPEALVPYDAPIQPRKYVTPSATSRKEVPAVFAKKRSRSQAFDDEDGEDDVSLNPDDVDAIEAKRRQNTLAARRSRKRKLEYQRDLEATVDKANDEKNYWMDRAMALESTLRTHGIDVPPLRPAPGML